MTNQQKPDFDLPDGLVDRLKQADQAPAVITAKVDRAVSAMTSEQFSTRPGRRISAPVWLSAAASVALAVFIVQMQAPAPSEGVLYSDVDGSGQIDIADVMAMAMREQDDVSAAELEAFAMQVVALGDTS